MAAHPTADAAPRAAGDSTGAGGDGGRWRFDRFELDLERSALSADGQPIALRPKTFALLCLLVAHPGRLLSKDELLDKLWPGVVVTEDSVSQCIGELRAALSDRAQQLIKTVP